MWFCLASAFRRHGIYMYMLCFVATVATNAAGATGAKDIVKIEIVVMYTVNFLIDLWFGKLISMSSKLIVY